MDVTNVVVLRGVVTTDPLVRDLPSGGTVTQLEVKTDTHLGSSVVPIAARDQAVDVAAGDEVVVIGIVHRRFFRARGSTHSRTEVIATEIIKASRRKSVQRAAQAAAECLLATPR